jgi:tRNA(Arg) A34 adenosine deaminase TadA
MGEKTDESFMRLSLETAKEGVNRGNTPFGAVLVKDGKVAVKAHNRVWQDTDITAHAEIILLREGCRILNTVDLKGCVLYSSCEPCPMCFSAIHWANVSRVVYGARIEDAESLGFRELSISNARMKELGRSRMEISGPCLLDESLELFRFWKENSDGKTY